MTHRLTIKDIARLSGVGKSTVSRVLNNESGVRPQTRERIEAVMKQQGFSPSRSARAMRGQSDKVVAIIVTRLDSLSENLSVQTMLPYFYQHGYDPIMMESQFSAEKVAEHLSILQRRNIDGVILFGFTGLNEQILSDWRHSLVLIAQEAPGFSSVCFDDKGAVNLLMDKLYARGHRQVSFLGAPLEDMTTGLRRYHAYLDFCQTHQLPSKACLPGLTMKLGYQHAPEVIDDHTSALVCATDGLALGASKYLQEVQRTDIQLASVGNTPLITFLNPEIITVNPGYGDAGLRAAQLLITLINGNQDTQQLLIPSQLQ